MATRLPDTKTPYLCDTQNTKRDIRNLGEVVEFIIPRYSEMKIPQVAVAKQGKRKSELDVPRGVAFEDESGLIFVCDSCNSCVKVFDSTGEFVNDFGSNELMSPWGILLHRNHIYVTDLDKCTLLKYQRSNYQFLLSLRKKGPGVGIFNCPGQLAIGPDQCLYVPELENNRISVLDTELNFKNHFKHRNIVKPADVRFTEDTMFVLTSVKMQTINSFNLDGVLIKCSSLNVEGIVYFFTIDCIGNILISDMIGHSVVVFSTNGELLSTIGSEGNDKGEFYLPFGICITRNGKLIVASNNLNYGLQIF